MDPKTQTRNSIVGHLKALESFGIDSILSSDLPKPASTSVHDKRPLQNGSPSQTETIPVNQSSQITTLESLREHIGDCKRCKLNKGRKNLVFGVGDPKARLMFIGEGPGADEDEKGEPFVGRAGQLLTKIILAMGFTREDVYIANCVKCRPPNNRNPELDELALCMPFLKEQIRIIQPNVIMCLGKFAAQTVLNTQIPISKLRGAFRDVGGTAVMPTFHPAYLLRNPSMKKLMWDDCKKVMERLAKS